MSVFTGLDVHKEYHHATAMDKNGEILRQRRFPNSLEGIKSFFSDIEGGEVALEASGFWEPVYDELEEMGLEVKLAHPRKTRVIEDEEIKTDLRFPKRWHSCSEWVASRSLRASRRYKGA